MNLHHQTKNIKKLLVIPQLNFKARLEDEGNACETPYCLVKNKEAAVRSSWCCFGDAESLSFQGWRAELAQGSDSRRLLL